MINRRYRALDSLYSRARQRINTDERGAELAEYGLLIVLIGITVIGILILLGGEVWDMFAAAEAEFDNVRNTAPATD